MGIDTRAVILVGLPLAELPESLREYDERERVGLERIAPYYDGDDEYCVFGFIAEKTGSYTHEQLNLDRLTTAVAKAEERFRAVTGLPGKVYLTPQVW